MSDTIKEKTSLTRRNFLKTTAAVAGATAISGSTLTAFAAESGDAGAESTEQVYQGVCRGNCMGGCPLDIYVRNGKVVRVSASDVPDDRYKRACMKGLSHPQKMYLPDRILYPMKRAEGTERGAGAWERITWDEAISTICNEWTRLRKEYGTGAIGWWTQSGQFGLLSGCHYNGAYTRLQNAMQAIPISGSIDMNYYTASSAMFGSSLVSQTNELTDFANAKTIIAWGSNLTEAQIQAWHFFADAIDNGAKLIVIDPAFTTIASKADLYVPLRPASDAALALGMCNMIIEKDLVDWDFVKNHSVAPFLVKEDGTYLRQSDLGLGEKGAKTDQVIVIDAATGEAVASSETTNPTLEGTHEVAGFSVRPAFALLLERIAEYTPEKASELSDVPVEVMEQIVDLYTQNGPASMFWGFGQDRYYNGHGSYYAMGTMSILAGNIGKKGCSTGACSYNSVPLDAKLCTSPIKAKQEDTVGGGSASYTAGVLALKMAEAIKTGTYNGKPFVMKSIYIHNCNPLNYVADRQSILHDVFDKMELIVVAETRPTDTTVYADIVLPSAHWFEQEDFTCGTAHLQPFAVLQEKAVEPMGECKPDYEIFKLLAEGLDMPYVYDGLNSEEALRYILDTPTAAKFGISYDRMKKEKVVRWLPGKNFIFAAGGNFTTPTGRAQFYFEKPVASMQYGQTIDVELEHLPFFIEPSEAWPSNPLAKKYPLTCYQEHTRYRVHSNFSHIPWLREFDPEPTVKIHTKDAEARNIKSGDMVRLFNDRGSCTVRAIVTEGIRPGTVNTPHGWQADQYVEGHYQDLTSRETNPYIANSQFSDLLVEIEKA
ncbi:molybdopterin-dependent oxidoreductase [Adlercreutzia sp. ZJ154]|uniref:molybdopterin-containing oxidoreductase family protein n=1 Tax=Adlercreutzia sp. ZJ154 TaxID=2709790 RepID=UPI0013EC3C69|nr:molybdopterin-dependent oxidoreductase [Adlercreutzia sp. ZJ154]